MQRINYTGISKKTRDGFEAARRAFHPEFFGVAHYCCRQTSKNARRLSVSSFDIVCRFLVDRGNEHIGGIGVFNDLAH